jgi:hypothetical protein
VTITSTLSRTNSIAISANRSVRPSAQRYSIAMVRPSIQPSSRSLRSKAMAHGLQPEDVPVPKNPIVGNLGPCCARATNGKTTAELPSSVMNSRRFISGFQVSERHRNGEDQQLWIGQIALATVEW